jgi:hypothetical protein
MFSGTRRLVGYAESKRKQTQHNHRGITAKNGSGDISQVAYTASADAQNKSSCAPADDQKPTRHQHAAQTVLQVAGLVETPSFFDRASYFTLHSNNSTSSPR